MRKYKFNDQIAGSFMNIRLSYILNKRVGMNLDDIDKVAIAEDYTYLNKYHKDIRNDLKTYYDNRVKNLILSENKDLFLFDIALKSENFEMILYDCLIFLRYVYTQEKDIPIRDRNTFIPYIENAFEDRTKYMFAECKTLISMRQLDLDTYKTNIRSTFSSETEFFKEYSDHAPLFRDIDLDDSPNVLLNVLCDYYKKTSPCQLFYDIKKIDINEVWKKYLLLRIKKNISSSLFDQEESLFKMIESFDDEFLLWIKNDLKLKLNSEVLPKQFIQIYEKSMNKYEFIENLKA